MSARRDVMRDGAALLLRQFVAMAAALVMTPVVARTLGAARFGFWSLLGTTAFLLGLCDLGLTGATFRVAADADAPAAKRAAKYCARVTALLAIPVGLACWGWLATVAQRLPETERRDALVATAVALAFGILNATLQSARSYAHGRGRLVDLAMARWVGACSQLVVTLSLLAAGMGLKAVACGYAVMVVGEGVFSLRAARDGVEAGGPISAGEKRALHVIGRHALTTNIAVAAAMRCDVVILERVTTLDVIGAYSVASRVVDQGFTFVKQVSGALAPRMGGRASDRDETIRRGTMALGVLAAAPLGAAAAAGAPLLVLWAGHAIDLPVLPVALAWLAVAAAIASIDEVAGSSLFLSGEPSMAARTVLAGAVLNVLISLVGSRFVGPAAVAAGTAFGNLLTATMVWTTFVGRPGWPARTVAATLAPPLVALVVASGAARALAHTVLHPIALLVASTALGVAAALVAARELNPGTKQVHAQ
ncbi:MAG TPA: oligosaccharide flippase family protein [Polyangiaceae bacterium]|nr:oligosaccharide flippase family protein [Polyangiaceae bacterium]